MNLDLVIALDELRDVYEVCKQKTYLELQSRLMRIRRMVLEGLHDTLNLYDENTHLRERLRGAHAEIRHLRAKDAPMSERDRSPGEDEPDFSSALRAG